MMVSVDNLILAFSIHYVADFLVQTQWQAENKSKNMTALVRHVASYSLCFAPFMYIMPQNGVQFFLANALFHFMTDFITSKASSSAYKEGNMKAFWGVIGFDQLIHHVTIMLLLAGFTK